MDVIVADLDKYEQLKSDPYLIYSEAENNGKMVYERPWKGKAMAAKGQKQHGTGKVGQVNQQQTLLE